MAKELIIVESPTKARTIKGILGGKYDVTSTMGHIRDLPASSFGVDIEKDFAPKYTIMPGKKKVVDQIKKAAALASAVYLATDEDREGEAIAWHTAWAINKSTDSVKRVAFHEITPEAVKNAFLHPRPLALDLVNAQQARRILDRLVGYTLSPLLGKHIQKGLSAGRVQSVALRLLVEREKEIDAFVPHDYWTVKAKVAREETTFFLNLVSVSGKKADNETFQSEETVRAALAQLTAGQLTVGELSKEDKTVRPFPPFTTSTLQQDASVKLSFPATKTMMIAQQLYEGIAVADEGSVGLITYMRTDSPSVAKPAQEQAFKYIKEHFGKDFVPDKPPVYKAKLATAQEAHEAIRPTSVIRTPESLQTVLTKDQLALYTLIWNRFTASQMKNAVVNAVKLTAANGIYGFAGERNRIVFPGFMKVWPVKIEEGEPLPEDAQPGEILPVSEYIHEPHQTKPPGRYTEASLIRTLEKFGIGRPSTYAPTIATLAARGYMKRDRRALVPQKIGKIVSEILVKFFPDIINVDFTAKMEEDLDNVAEGKRDWTAMLKDFYAAFKPVLDKVNTDDQGIRGFLNESFAGGKKCPQCGGALAVKRGRYGMFTGCSNYPDCKYIEREAAPAASSETGEQKTCPKCGGALVVKRSKYGEFYGCSNYPKCTHVERKPNAYRSRYRYKKRQDSPPAKG